MFALSKIVAAVAVISTLIVGVSATPTPAEANVDIPGLPHSAGVGSGRYAYKMWEAPVDTSKGVPGYQTVNINVNQADSFKDIPHSAVAAAFDSAADADYVEFNSNPAEGAYFYSQKGTNVTKALEYAEQHGASVPFVFTNSGKQGICILASATDHLHGNTFMFAPNKTDANNMLYVSPKSTVQVGNILPVGLGRFNGRMEAHFGCDKICGKCGGPSKPINTLFEWAMIRNTPEESGAEEGFWTDISNVDGLSANVNSTVFIADGKICQNHERRAIHTTAKSVKKLCPAHLFWHDKKSGAVGCSSECKDTGNEIHCCTGSFDRPDCPASSTFLKELTPEAYSYPHDDRGNNDICKGVKGVHVEFSPIK